MASPGKRKQKRKSRNHYLTRLNGDQRWYIAHHDQSAKQRRLVQSGVESDEEDIAAFDRAKKVIHEYVTKQQFAEPLNQADPTQVALARVLLEYWEKHGKYVASKDNARRAIDLWLAYFGEASVAAATPTRLAEFLTWLATEHHLGWATADRILSVGRAALRRALKLEQVTRVPNVPLVKATDPPFKDQPPFQRYRCSVQEISRLFDNAKEPHIRMFLMAACCTLARPENLLDLRLEQIDWENNCIRLNPPVHRR